MEMIVIRTTKDDGQRQSYGKKTEDYASITVILPLITKEDIERRILLQERVIRTVTINTKHLGI